ncbi:MAG TPA: hypothetical protein VJ978_13790 [Nitriliruptoraceae bacterium]|nr:hypothetical protein [Nitriliruptoraceae bacterium]
MTGLPRWLRVLVILIAIAAGVVVLFEWVFPWVEATWYNPSLE